MIRYTATGVNCTPRWVWVYFTDNTLVGGRPRAVRVPWGHIADVYRDICDGVNTEVAKRLAAEADRAQLPLPLETWE